MADSSFPFPLDAMPGDVATGPDGLPYQLGYDDLWRPCGERHGDRPPIPHAEADDPDRLAAEERSNDAFRARLLAEEAAERSAALAASARRSAGEEARRRLAAQDQRPDPEDLTARLYPDEYAAVLAEVPPGQRRDGWTAERRVLFLERLAECGSILAAARAAGVSRRAVYKLLPRAPAFAAALEEGLRTSTAVLADTLFDRAIHGHEVPIVHGGEVVATRTVHHDALGCYLLRVRDPLNYAPVDELDRWMARRGLDASTATRIEARPPAPGGPAEPAPDPAPM
jgi:hypothetical protein